MQTLIREFIGNPSFYLRKISSNNNKCKSSMKIFIYALTLTISSALFNIQYDIRLTSFHFAQLIFPSHPSGSASA